MKYLMILFLMSLTGMVSAQTPAIRIIPQPVDIQAGTGVFVLTPAAVISYDKADGKAVADMLAGTLALPTGYKFRPVQGKTGTIQLNLNATPDAKLGKEGYILTVSPKGIVVVANQTAGLFYGVQSLLQLLPAEIGSQTTVKAKWTLPAVKVTDYPRFGWRGLMLDVSRNFFTKEEVKKYIDEMAKFKFNTFHWHLTDDNGWRIEIKSLPKLTEVGAWRVPRYGHFGERIPPEWGEPATDGGFYTQDDIREIVKYAQDRFVTIVPEVDVPGHSMAAIAAYPELSCSRDQVTMVNPGSNFAEWYGDGTFKMLIDNTLDPSSDRVYEFLDKVFTEMAALFPNPYIHVGGDECYKGYWEKDSACQVLMKKENLHEVEQLQGYFMNRLEVILKAKGKKLLGWDEILEGGISPEATVMSWRGIKGGIEAAKQGHDVVMAPTTFAYLDYTQGDRTIDFPIYNSLRLQKSYGFDPVPEGVDPKFILGGQGNLWTEQIPTLHYAFYMTYPRGWALSEVYWTPNEKKNYANFVERVENQFKRADISGIGYSKAIYDPIVNVTKKDNKLWIDMASEVPGLDIFYTLDNTMPDKYAQKYKEPFALPDGPVSIRVIAYRNGAPMGHLIILNPDELKKRAE